MAYCSADKRFDLCLSYALIVMNGPMAPEVPVASSCMAAAQEMEKLRNASSGQAITDEDENTPTSPHSCSIQTFLNGI
jgi:hypothetical protein